MAGYTLINIKQAFNVYDDVIDVRSHAEFVDDHIPNALSLPVLNDEERARIGTLYTQVSPFEAKKLGAALIARNISNYLEIQLSDKPKSWRPLIYCWRGGMRSGAMSHILAQIGYKTAQLEGGYKSYRRHVINAIDELPKHFNFIVISGCTGTGKSQLLRVLVENGAQVLDLEKLAQHRGSLLGRLPNQLQPSQKVFETRLWQQLNTFTPERPVYIESESRKVGVLSLPTSLVEKMRESSCIRIEVPLDVRVNFLIEDYVHFIKSPALLVERLELLIETHGHAVTNNWCNLANKGQWHQLVSDLLTHHYDPAYKRAANIGFQRLNESITIELNALDDVTLMKVAEDLIAKERQNND